MNVRIFLALVALNAVAHAEPAVVETLPSGAETHDGFYLRMATGPASMGGNFHANGRDVGFGGVGQQLEVSVGGAVAENLILHGDLFVASSEFLDGEDEETNLDLGEAGMTVAGVGGGITWYTAQNIYLSGALYLTEMRLHDHDDFEEFDTIAQTDWAGMGRFTIGKEWWVSENWGLGLAGSVYGGVGVGDYAGDQVGPTDDEAEAGFGGVSLMFSATYN